jgi:hypothetical protein
VFGEGNRVADGFVVGAARAGDGLVQHGEAQLRWHARELRTSDLSVHKGCP